MSQQDRLQLVKEIVRAFTQEESIAPLLDAVTEDVEVSLTVTTGTPLSQVFKGKAGLEEYFVRSDQVIEINKREFLNILAGGDQVAAVGRETFTVRRSGRVATDCDFVLLYTFREGKIAKIAVIEDSSELALAWC